MIHKLNIQTNFEHTQVTIKTKLSQKVEPDDETKPVGTKFDDVDSSLDKKDLTNSYFGELDQEEVL